jgi:uncharacterized membrane protein
MNERNVPGRPSPLHAIILGFIFPLSLGALLSDWRYSFTYEIQWINFADWLVAGSLVGGGLALAWTLVSTTLRGRWRHRPSVGAALLLVLFFAVQFINALTHSKDAYATMPAALILSIVATLLAFAAAWFGLRSSDRDLVQ